MAFKKVYKLSIEDYFANNSDNLYKKLIAKEHNVTYWSSANDSSRFIYRVGYYHPVVGDNLILEYCEELLYANIEEKTYCWKIIYRYWNKSP